MNQLVITTMLLASSVATAGPCPSPQAHVEVLGAVEGATIDQGTGIVAAVRTEFGGGDGPASLAKLDWKFVANGKASAPKVTLLAPGLAVLAPAMPAQGALVLQDGKATKLAGVTYAASLARLAIAAPTVKAIAFSRSSGPRSASEATTAVLATPPPTGTVAVLVYKAGAQQAGKPASAWANVNLPGDPKLTRVTLYAASRCSAPVGSGEAPMKDDKVVLVWVATTGTLSAPSAEVTVQ